MMISSTPAVRDDRCLVPVSARFALSQAGLPTSEEFPSGAETRPFALRFVLPPNRALNDPLPPYRYCPVRQVLVSDDDDEEDPVVWQSFLNATQVANSVGSNPTPPCLSPTP